MKTLVVMCLFVLPLAAQTVKPIPVETLRDKIAGGWAGQMIGVSYGAPTEFRYKGRIIPDEELPRWKPGMVANSIDQDDLYVDMTFAQVLDDKGLDATTEDFGAMFREAKYRLWHANLAARRALKRGVPATLSGTPKYNIHANDIDFQIEADFIGLMAPGLPLAATDIAWRAGRVMNYGDGIYGGIFVSCMYSSAFFEKNPRKIVEDGLACLPRKSPYAQVIADVLLWHRQHPEDWKRNWQLIEDKWNRSDPCPEGALLDFNIDAKINGAYIALGLLYGNGDFGRTVIISTQAGQDSDCNPSNAAGILGVAHGYSAIPEDWKAGIPAVADKTFSYTNFTFKTITESTLKRAIALAEKTGGRREAEVVHIRTQAPRATKLEVWDDYGSPVERIAATDARFRRTGTWEVGRNEALLSSEKGASAEVEFEGTGFILVGQFLPDGGLADIALDGKIVATVDVYPDEDSMKNRESLYHAFNLKPGKHTVRLTVRGEPYRESRGAKISLQGLVVFR
ncbi:MAG: ADP-ribosylglycohydrolase family protein [Bryobacteraceae bacterium]|nr:ADP-ribosylglycohydrolase family protein [Bryobacteraceae bacterium]